jgi:CheY-like chemotaxis protein
MPRVRLIHWNAAEAEERIAGLRAAGYDVEHEAKISPEGFRSWRTNPPAAFVIDLTRMPSHGREVALTLRITKSTRNIPLVFVEGEPEKVERIKTHLPDAVYTTWGRIRGSLKKAISKPPSDPVVPESNLAGYSGTPLPGKLGIKPRSTVALIGAPKDFERTLGELPEGVKLKKQARGGYDLIIWFVRLRAELHDRIVQMGELAGDGGLWIAWPKQASGVASDLTQNVVRETGLASGLVDYKVCAIDATWSGLKFTRRKPK